jgi:hypothetical protein
MEEHETRRKIIREWMKLPKDKRLTEEQVAAFAKGLCSEMGSSAATTIRTRR